ncbi:MAG: multicopper oxidase family protein [Acidimicrobiales bacterium]
MTMHLSTELQLTFEALRDRADLFDRSALLPRPARLRPTVHGDGLCRLAIEQVNAEVTIHPQLPLTRAWTYGGSLPGPVIEVETGDHVHVTHRNSLTGLLPCRHVVADTTAGGSMNDAGREWASTAPEDELEAMHAGALHPYTSVHLHGGPTSPDSDGSPENVIGTGRDRTVEYEFPRETWPMVTGAGVTEYRSGAAPMYWYHDHAMSATRFNVFAGLAGVCLVRDPIETMIGLPTSQWHEIPLVLMDRGFDTVDGTAGGALDGALLHKVETDVRECFSPVNLVNGLAWPRCRVSPRVHRLRLVNGSNARTYRLHFLGQATTADAPAPVETAVIQQIGTDGGLLGRAVDLPDGSLILSPGERADVLVDFGLLARAGIDHLVVANSAASPFKGEDLGGVGEILTGDPARFRVTPEVMRFDLTQGPAVSGLRGRPIAGLGLDPNFRRTPVVHDELPDDHGHTLIVLREEAEVVYDAAGAPVVRDGRVVTRTMLYLHEMLPRAAAERLGANLHAALVDGVDDQGQLVQVPAGVSLVMPGDPTVWVTAAKRFHDGVMTHIPQGSWRLFKVVNVSPDTHPFHVHLTQLQPVSRVALSRSDGATTPGSAGEFTFDVAADIGVDRNEEGWKDTFRVNPGHRDPDTEEIVSAEMVTIVGCFANHAGRYIYHCHILEHEDSDMMRSFTVVPPDLLALGMPHPGH